MGGCMSSPSYSKKVKYEDLKSTLKTGDIFLSSGNGAYAKLIKFATGDPMTHVGMIIVVQVPTKLASGYILGPERPYLLQSTLGRSKDARNLLRGRISSGVQLNKLDDIVKHENGEIYIRHIKGVDLKVTLPVKNYMEGIKNIPYEQNLIELINAATGMNTKDDPSSMFCSELVAEMYYTLDVADRDDNDFSNNYLPGSFSEDAKNEFVFKEGISLGDTIKVVV